MKQSKKGTNKDPGRKTTITSKAVESKQEARTRKRNEARTQESDRIKHSEGKQTRAKDTGVQMH